MHQKFSGKLTSTHATDQAFSPSASLGVSPESKPALTFLFVNLVHLFERTMAKKSTLTKWRETNNNTHVSCSQKLSIERNVFALTWRKEPKGVVKWWADFENSGATKQRTSRIEKRSESTCPSFRSERKKITHSFTIDYLIPTRQLQEKGNKENTRSMHTISYSSQWKPMIRGEREKEKTKIRLNQIPVNEKPAMD